jgi:hypothetical protein
MKLRVFARPGHVLPWPGQMTSGQLRRYVGRESKVRDGVISHRAHEEPTVLDTDSDDWKQFVADQELVALVPADEESAKAMGVKFVAGKVVNGEWQPESGPVDEVAVQAEFRKEREARRAKRNAEKSQKRGAQKPAASGKAAEK